MYGFLQAIIKRADVYAELTERKLIQDSAELEYDFVQWNKHIMELDNKTI